MAEELGERIHEAVEHAHEHGSLGSIVALLVALSATFRRGCRQGSQRHAADNQAQAKSIDVELLQASMKQNLAEATLDQMTAVGGAAASLER
jgi:hypothetical protein